MKVSKPGADVCEDSGSDPGTEVGEAWTLFLRSPLAWALSGLGSKLKSTYDGVPEQGAPPLCYSKKGRNPPVGPKQCLQG